MWNSTLQRNVGFGGSLKCSWCLSQAELPLSQCCSVGDTERNIFLAPLKFFEFMLQTVDFILQVSVSTFFAPSYACELSGFFSDNQQSASQIYIYFWLFSWIWVKSWWKGKKKKNLLSRNTPSSVISIYARACVHCCVSCQRDYALPIWLQKGRLIIQQTCNNLKLFLRGDSALLLSKNFVPNEEVSWIFEQTVTVWLGAQMTLFKGIGFV